MKLNNHLIVTLPDFARHFNFSEFWVNRRQFVRDMNPDKIYYWNDELKEAYQAVKLWVEEGEHVEMSVRKVGIKALNKILGKDVSDEIVYGMDSIDASQEIIILTAGQHMDFPPFTGETNNQPLALRLHKIEVHGNASIPVRISIGGTFCVELNVGDVAYITEANGGFIEVLPSHVKNDKMELTLLNEEGMFGSTLVIRDLLRGASYSFKGVCSFALSDCGYIYIDKNGIPVFCIEGAFLKSVLKHVGSAFYVKSDGEEMLILYKDGTLKSTFSMDSVSGVCQAWFDDENRIKIHKINNK